MTHPGRPAVYCGVSSYQDLDAFKACHALTLAVHGVTEKLAERDEELAGQLWASALIASSRIARGSGFRHRRMFAACADRALAALAEISYHLELARAMDLLSAEDRQELESLGGRALFYVMKLAMSLEPDPSSGGGPPKE
jgi:four helix bundle protein